MKTNIAEPTARRTGVLFCILAITITLLLVAGAVFGFFYRKVKYQERALRDSVSIIEKVGGTFAIELGEPTARSRKESCRYINAPEFGLNKGRLSCSVSLNLWRPMSDGYAAEKQVVRLQHILADQEYVTVVASIKPGGGFNTGIDPYRNLASDDLLTTSTASCVIMYEYASSEMRGEIGLSDTLFMDNGKGVLGIRLSCTIEASRAILPLKNNDDNDR